VRDASSKPSHYDHNPLFRSFFQANINRFGSHSYDRTRHLHDFVERRRFQLPFWRRPFWRDLLAAVAVPTRSRGRTGTADVFSKRWIGSCILVATAGSIATASAAHSQAVVFRLRPTLLSRCWFLLRLRREWRSSHLAAECKRTKDYCGYKWRILQSTDAIH